MDRKRLGAESRPTQQNREDYFHGRNIIINTPRGKHPRSPESSRTCPRATNHPATTAPREASWSAAVLRRFRMHETR